MLSGLSRGFDPPQITANVALVDGAAVVYENSILSQYIVSLSKLAFTLVTLPSMLN